MKTLLGAIGFLIASTSPAWAGTGATAYVGGYADGTRWNPSLDYRAKGILVQLHVLDWVQAPGASGYDFVPNAGVDVTGVAIKKKVGPDVEGVWMPGGGVRIQSYGGTLSWNAMAQARFGAEMKQGMGIGVYVVPAVGVTNFLTGDVGFNYGGSLQVSAWFLK
jgi:hypothetical protein